MHRFTVDQVKSLAPDSAAFNSGQGLADMRHWVGLGSNDAALWGECKGSGKEPYKTRIDLSNNGSACTCPSRKFPDLMATAIKRDDINQWAAGLGIVTARAAQ